MHITIALNHELWSQLDLLESSCKNRSPWIDSTCLPRYFALITVVSITNSHGYSDSPSQLHVTICKENLSKVLTRPSSWAIWDCYLIPWTLSVSSANFESWDGEGICISCSRVVDSLTGDKLGIPDYKPTLFVKRRKWRKLRIPNFYQIFLTIGKIKNYP